MTNQTKNVLITVQFPEELLEKVRQVSPTIRVITSNAQSPEDVSVDLWNKVEILYTDRILPAPSSVPNLRWIQSHYAGVDAIAGHPLLQQRDINVTTLSGAAASQVAEYAIMMMLALGRKMPDLIANQKKAEWPRDRWERFRPVEIRGSTVGLVGYGSIGREIARIVTALGGQVVAVKRDVKHPSDSGYMPEKMGDPEGDLFSRLYPVQALKAMLKICDFVVICLPLTPSTRGLIAETELAAMKSSAYLIDVSRGGIVNPTALLAALQEKQIAGAGLDVFIEEPLPPTSPLWKLPNVLITPHISGISAHYAQRAIDLFCENLKRYLAGSNLLNRFDPDWGY
jgi:phosphoglycerate dehydrogenase-like enzyme